MAEFLRSEEIIPEIRRIVAEAHDLVGIATYSIRLDNDLIFELQQADRRGVSTTIVHGRIDFPLNWNRKQLSLLARFKAYVHPRLHAKCYFNEREFVLTSMNLDTIRKRSSIETGVVLDAGSDQEAYSEAVGYFTAMVALSAKYTFRGFCSGCKKDMPFGTAHPFCASCYHKRAQGIYCHMCGTQSPLSEALHICEACERGQWDE